MLDVANLLHYKMLRVTILVSATYLDAHVTFNMYIVQVALQYGICLWLLWLIADFHQFDEVTLKHYFL